MTVCWVQCSMIWSLTVTSVCQLTRISQLWGTFSLYIFLQGKIVRWTSFQWKNWLNVSRNRFSFISLYNLRKRQYNLTDPVLQPLVVALGINIVPNATTYIPTFRSLILILQAQAELLIPWISRQLNQNLCQVAVYTVTGDLENPLWIQDIWHWVVQSNFRH